MTFLRRVHQLEDELREHVNAPSRHAVLIRDPRRFSMLASALDVLGDTELAIDSFLESDDDDAHPGEVYIAVYGVLQALFLQQDALTHLHEALEAPFALDDTLRRIREWRNDATGHPTKRAGGTSFHMIVRNGMSRRGFTMWSFDAAGEPKERYVDIPQLLREQEASISSALAKLVEVERTRSHNPSEP